MSPAIERPPVDTRGRKGIGGHTRPNDGATVEWYTPPGIFRALGLDFDLDPCSPPGGLPWVPAARSISLPDDGLAAEWSGRVWLNPPYGPATGVWLARLADHGDGVALVFARTETEWWHASVPRASAVCFVRGRLTFVGRDGRPGHYNAGGPSALIAYGSECADALVASQLGMAFRCAQDHSGAQLGIWAA